MQILKLFKLFNYLLHKELVAVGNGQWSSSNDNLDFLLSVDFVMDICPLKICHVQNILQKKQNSPPLLRFFEHFDFSFTFISLWE